MKESTLVINHSAAHSVTTNAQQHTIWRDTKQSTQVQNLSAAPNVTSNADNQVIGHIMCFDLYVRTREVTWLEKFDEIDYW